MLLEGHQLTECVHAFEDYFVTSGPDVTSWSAGFHIAKIRRGIKLGVAMFYKRNSNSPHPIPLLKGERRMKKVVHTGLLFLQENPPGFDRRFG